MIADVVIVRDEGVDLPGQVKVREAIDDIGYRGWLVIESAVASGMTVRDSYVHNQKFLRSVFQHAST